MNLLNNPSFMPLTREEIVNSCEGYPVSEDESMQLRRYIACDMQYTRMRWKNGIETILVRPNNQMFMTNKQVVEAYCAAVSQLHFGRKSEVVE